MIKIKREDNIKLLEPEVLQEKNIEDEKYIPSKQSANVLFKFMNKIEYLKDIISKMAILPRYYEESIEYLNIESLNKIVFPMICFCDINLSKLDEHVCYYGKFGIGFNKTWAINEGIQPIHYINKKSSIKKDISYLFSKALNNTFDNDNNISEYKDYLLHHLIFMKPVIGSMRRNSYYDNKNFTDEKEWRFIPKIKEEYGMPLIIPLMYLENDKAYNSYSDGISQLPELWLHFHVCDIEYLMVEDENYRKELIEFILKITTIEELDKYILISKIIVYDTMNKDW